MYMFLKNNTILKKKTQVSSITQVLRFNVLNIAFLTLTCYQYFSSLNNIDRDQVYYCKELYKLGVMVYTESSNTTREGHNVCLLQIMLVNYKTGCQFIR